MIDTFKYFHYQAFGLTVSSEILLPELLPINIVDQIIDVVIEKADLASIWLKESDSKNDFIVKPNWFMFHIPDVAFFLIMNGKQILFSPSDKTNEDELRLYILGSCMGAILLQRKILPLHGSAIAIDGKAIAIVGDSGAGKSTLASAFLKRGYQLLSDDVIPVSLADENIPIITPSYPQQKLWLESLHHYKMDPKKYKPLVVREEKFAVPVSSQFSTDSLPLVAIFELDKTDKNEIILKPIQDLERLYKLYYHTYRNLFLPDSELMDWHFNFTSKMMNKVQFYQICRPTTRFTAYDLTNLILNTLESDKALIKKFKIESLPK